MQDLSCNLLSQSLEGCSLLAQPRSRLACNHLVVHSFDSLIVSDGMYQYFLRCIRSKMYVH